MNREGGAKTHRPPRIYTRKIQEDVYSNYNSIVGKPCKDWWPAERNRDTDVENKPMDTKGGKWWWDELGDWDWHVHTNMYKMDN